MVASLREQLQVITIQELQTGRKTLQLLLKVDR